MAETKIIDLTGQPCGAEVTEDFARGRKFGFVRVGELGVYWRVGMNRRYAPFGLLRRAFLRVRPLQAKLCCGRMSVEQVWVVLWDETGEIAQIEVRDQARGDAILAAILAHRPELPLGVPEA